jgi:outer membrane protein
MKRSIIPAFLLFFHTGASAQQDSSVRITPLFDTVIAPATTVYTLQQCIDSAIRNNPTVKLSEFLQQGAKANRDQQIGIALPNISAYTQYINSGGRSVNVSTNQYVNQDYNQGYGQVQASLVLWNGFSIHNLIREYSLAYQADKMDWQAAKDLATVNTIQAYLQVLSNQEQLILSLKQAAASARKVGLMEIQNKEGSISPIDLSDARGQLAQDQLTTMTIRNTLETNKYSMAVLMNIPYSPNLGFAPLAEDLTPIAYNSTIDQVYQNAFRHLALVKAAQLHVAAADKALRATLGQMMPTLSAFSQISSNYSTEGNVEFKTQVDDNRFTQFGLELNIPILQGFRYRTQHRLAKINLEQAKFTANTAMTTLRQSVEAYFVTMMSYFRTYNGLVNQVQYYAESYRGAQIKYDAGALPSLSFIIYKTNFDNASLSLIQAKYNYILQTKILDYYQGTLTW